MTLDFSPFARAVARLEEGLERFRLDTADTQIRDGLIQRFEFAYDLTHKMVRRALEHRSAAAEEVDQMSFPTLIRTANETGLVGGEWSDWLGEAFDESALSCKVDLVDRHAVSEAFGRIIDAGKIELR